MTNIMNTFRAVELQSQVTVLFSALLQNNYASILFVLGKAYLKAFGNSRGLVSVHAELGVAEGPIGKK